jgi:tetratricopeptide (TPR) repeat protein
VRSQLEFRTKKIHESAVALDLTQLPGYLANAEVYLRFPVRGEMRMRIVLCVGWWSISALALAAPVDEERALNQTIQSLEAEKLRSTDRSGVRLALVTHYEKLASLCESDCREVEARTALEQALKFHDELIAFDPQNPAPRRNRLQTQFKLARLLTEMHLWKEAEVANLECMAAAQRASGEFPQEVGFRSDQAQAIGLKAGWLWNQFRRKEACDQKQLERTALVKSVNEFPQQLPLRVELAKTDLTLGFWMISLGDHPRAETVLQEALTLAKTLAEHDPQSTAYQVELERTRDVFAYLYREAGKWLEAEGLLRLNERDRRANRAKRASPDQENALIATLRSLALVHQLTEKSWEIQLAFEEIGELELKLTRTPVEPTSRSREEFLSLNVSHETINRIANASPPKARVQSESKAYFASCLEAVEKHSKIPGYRYRLSNAEIFQGLSAFNSGDVTEAMLRAENMLKIMNQLASEHPEVPFYRLQIALGEISMVSTLFSQGKAEQASKLGEQAFARLAKLEVDFPGDAFFQYQACEAEMVLARPGDEDSAFRYRLQAYHRKANLAEKFPQTQQYRIHLAVASNAIGQRLAAQGQGKEAESFFREAIRHWQVLVRSENNPYFLSNLSRAQAKLALHLHDQGKPRDAEGLLDEAMKGFRKTVQEHPKETAFRLSLARGHNLVASLVLRAEKTQEAVNWYSESLKEYDELLKQNSANSLARSEMVTLLKDRGLAYNSLKKFEEYNRDWEKAKQISEEGDLIAQDARRGKR